MKIFKYEAKYDSGKLITFVKKTYRFERLCYDTRICNNVFFFFYGDVATNFCSINTVFRCASEKYSNFLIFSLYDNEEKFLNYINKLNERNDNYGKIL